MLSVFVFSNIIHNYAILGAALIMLFILLLLGCVGEIFFIRRGRPWLMLAVPAALIAISEVVYLFYKGYEMFLVMGYLHYIWALLIGAALGWIVGKMILRGK